MLKLLCCIALYIAIFWLLSRVLVRLYEHWCFGETKAALLGTLLGKPFLLRKVDRLECICMSFDTFLVLYHEEPGKWRIYKNYAQYNAKYDESRTWLTGSFENGAETVYFPFPDSRRYKRWAKALLAKEAELKAQKEAANEKAREREERARRISELHDSMTTMRAAAAASADLAQGKIEEAIAESKRGQLAAPGFLTNKSRPIGAALFLCPQRIRNHPNLEVLIKQPHKTALYFLTLQNQQENA